MDSRPQGRSAAHHPLETDNKNITMADISVKESPVYNKYNPLITTSTPYKSINDSGYNTQSSTISNASSNLSQISEVSISFDHTSSNLNILQLSPTTHNFTQDYNGNKLEDITNTTNSNSNVSPLSQDLSPSKKFKFSSDMRLRFRLQMCPNDDDDSQALKRKTPSPTLNVNHPRISLEGREKIDIMYFLSKRNHFELVTEKIFSFLYASDFVSMSLVSKVWNNAVKTSPTAQKNIKKYCVSKTTKENRFSYDSRDRSAFHNIAYLANISNVMRSPPRRDVPQRSPPVSPSKLRFHEFQKEAKKLNSNQQLVYCPRCSRPASCSPKISTRAECKGYHCKFIFCTNCKCEFSENKHKCPPKLSVSSSNSRPVKSSLSKIKRNLRRL